MGSPHTRRALPLLISVLYTPRTVDSRLPTEHHTPPSAWLQKDALVSCQAANPQGCNLPLTTHQALYSESRYTSREHPDSIVPPAHNIIQVLYRKIHPLFCESNSLQPHGAACKLHCQFSQ